VSADWSLGAKTLPPATSTTQCESRSPTDGVEKFLAFRMKVWVRASLRIFFCLGAVILLANHRFRFMGRVISSDRPDLFRLLFL